MTGPQDSIGCAHSSTYNQPEFPLDSMVDVVDGGASDVLSGCYLHDSTD